MPECIFFKRYQTIHNGERHLLRCSNCEKVFSQTHNIAMERIKSPISTVAATLRLRSEGLGLRATGRILNSHKGTIAGWESKFAEQKASLMLYAFCH